MQNKKKNNPRLIKKQIIDKDGKKTTVYINPNKTINEIKKELKEKNKLHAVRKVRKSENEAVKVSKKGKVFFNPDTFEGLQEKYKSRPISWKVMTDGKWLPLKKGDRISLTNIEWKKLLQENDKMIHFAAKKYSFGEVYSERFKELKAIGQSAFVEGINKYKKVYNKTKPFDLQKFVFVYVQGRIKEAVANRLDAGLRVPKGLQEPYYQYVDTKRKLQEKLGVKPSREVIAKHLQKIWTKQTFYSQYRTTEGKEFGNHFVVKDKKTGKVLYEGTDALKAKKKQVKGKTDLITRARGFSDLTEEEKKKVKLADQLPLQGWVTINKEGVLQDKETKHEENLSKIEDEFQKRKENLEATYYSTNNMSSTDRFKAKEITDLLQKRVEEVQNKIKETKTEKIDKIIVIEAEIEAAKENLKQFEGKRNSKNHIDAKKKLALVNSDRYRDSQVAGINEKLRSLKDAEEKAVNDLRMSKQLFEPMTEKTFNERVAELDRIKQQELDAERKRHNKDTSSTYIPGVIERIKEFEQIEAIKEQPLNLYVDDGEGDSKSTLEVTYVPDQMNEEEKMTLLQEHEIGKEVLKDHLQLLIPAYKDIMSMRMGLHKLSKPTVDNLWGELATAKEIVSYLDKKHEALLNNQDKFLSMVGKKFTSNTDRFLLIKSVPFVTERYFYNPELIKKDFDSWEASKPKAGAKKKVKLKPETYKKLRKKYLDGKKKAKTQWLNWRKSHKQRDQKTSTKVYQMLKKKNKATSEFKPKRFVMVVTKKVEPKKMDAWKQKKPKIFYDSYSGKEKYVLNAISDSTEILRRTVPLKAVKNLLDTHRRLVEAGVTAEKSINDEFQNLKHYFIKSFQEITI